MAYYNNNGFAGIIRNNNTNSNNHSNNSDSEENNKMMSYDRSMANYVNNGSGAGMNGFVNSNRLYSQKGINASSSTNHNDMGMAVMKNDASVNDILYGGSSSMIQQQHQQLQQQQQLMFQKYLASQQNNSTKEASYLSPYLMQYGSPGMNLMDSTGHEQINQGSDENLLLAASVAASGLFSNETVEDELLKSRKRKKPKDKPKRPLSAYNLFFKEERTKILSLIPDKQVKVKDEEEAPTDLDHDDNDATESQDNQDQSTLGADGKKKKKKRKKKDQSKKVPHGKISFESLAKQIGAKWKNLDPEDKQTYQEKAQEDTARYAREMEQYTKKMSSESNKKVPAKKVAMKKKQDPLRGYKHLKQGKSPKPITSVQGLLKDDLSNKRQKVEEHTFQPYYNQTAAMLAASYNQQQSQKQQMSQMMYNSSSSQANNSSLLQQYNQLMMMKNNGDQQMQQQQQQQQMMLQQQMQSHWKNYHGGNGSGNSNAPF